MKKAILTNKITGVSVEVHESFESSNCSYGHSVWVDNDGFPYCQVGSNPIFYDLYIID